MLSRQCRSNILGVFLLGFSSFAFAQCTLTYGALKYDHQKSWQPTFTQALTDATECKIYYKTFNSEKRLYQAVVNKKVDIAYLEAFTFYRAKKQNPEITPLAMTLSMGLDHVEPRTYYTGYLISLHANTKVNRVEDLANKTVGARAPDSSSSYIFSKVFFADHAISTKFHFYKKDSALFSALKAGKVVAAISWDAPVAASLPKEQIRILHTFVQLPTASIVMTHALPPTQVTALQEALYRLHPPTELPVVGYAPVPANIYDTVKPTFDRFCQLDPMQC